MTEVPTYTQQETTPVENKTATANPQAPEGNQSLMDTLIEYLYNWLKNSDEALGKKMDEELGKKLREYFSHNRLKDSDEELAKKRTELEKRVTGSKGIERRELQQRLRPIIMEQRYRRDPEAARIHEQWYEVQRRAMDEYTAWEKETKEKYGDEELGRRIRAGEYPKHEYKPGEEELWYKLMRIEVEEGARPEATLKFVKEREDAGGLRNWERQLQEKLDKELGVPQATLPNDTDTATTAKIADIQQELKTLSSVRQELAVEQ